MKLSLFPTIALAPDRAVGALFYYQVQSPRGFRLRLMQDRGGSEPRSGAPRVDVTLGDP